LKNHPHAKLRVYVVWMPVLAGDARSAWDPSVLRDPRVTQLWDQNQTVGTYLQQHRGPFWDAFLYYGPKARWVDAPTVPPSWGSTIIGSTDELQHDVEAAIEHKGAA
jgi:hypothetical protein